MPDDGIDDSTRVSCPRCDGEGVVTQRMETSTTYSANAWECWLCEGASMVTIATFRSYVVAGRPLDKPPGW